MKTPWIRADSRSPNLGFTKSINTEIPHKKKKKRVDSADLNKKQEITCEENAKRDGERLESENSSKTFSGGVFFFSFFFHSEN